MCTPRSGRKTLFFLHIIHDYTAGFVFFLINVSFVPHLVCWCFKPSQLQRIISGLKEAFIKRYIVERTNKAEIRPKEQNEKAETCREKLWNEIELKGS